MKKTTFALIIMFISCEKKIDNCACKFNLDIVIKNPSVYNQKYVKFYDEEYLNECFTSLEKGSETTIKEAYEYFDKRCPSYKLEHEIK